MASLFSQAACWAGLLIVAGVLISGTLWLLCRRILEGERGSRCARAPDASVNPSESEIESWPGVFCVTAVPVRSRKLGVVQGSEILRNSVPGRRLLPVHVDGRTGVAAVLERRLAPAPCFSFWERRLATVCRPAPLSQPPPQRRAKYSPQTPLSSVSSQILRLKLPPAMALVQPFFYPDHQAKCAAVHIRTLP